MSDQSGRSGFHFSITTVIEENCAYLFVLVVEVVTISSQQVALDIQVSLVLCFQCAKIALAAFTESMMTSNVQYLLFIKIKIKHAFYCHKVSILK